MEGVSKRVGLCILLTYLGPRLGSRAPRSPLVSNYETWGHHTHDDAHRAFTLYRSHPLPLPVFSYEGDGMSVRFKCCACLEALREGDRGLATECLHLFCVTCAENLFAAGPEALCPVPPCRGPLHQKNTKIVTVLAPTFDTLALALYGQVSWILWSVCVACQGHPLVTRHLERRLAPTNHPRFFSP